MKEFFELIKFLFAPKGPQLSRKQYTGAIFILLMVETFGFSFHLFNYSLNKQRFPFEFVHYSDSVFASVQFYYFSMVAFFDNVWPASLLLLIGSVFLVHRMLDNRGVQSSLLKAVSGIPVFMLFYLPDLFGHVMPIIAWSSIYPILTIFEDQFVSVFAALYIFIALAGLILLVQLGKTAIDDNEFYPDLKNSKFFEHEQYGRFEYMVVNLKYYIISLLTLVTIGILTYLLSEATFGVRRRFGMIFLVTVVIISLIMVFYGIRIIVRRIRNMGKSAPKLVLGFMVIMGIIQAISFGLMITEWSFLFFLGFLINFLTIPVAYLYIFYIAFSPGVDNAFTVKTS